MDAKTNPVSGGGSLAGTTQARQELHKNGKTRPAHLLRWPCSLSCGSCSAGAILDQGLCRMRITITDDHPIALPELRALMRGQLGDADVIAVAPCRAPDSFKTRNLLKVLH
jgi:hypothetical protein